MRKIILLSVMQVKRKVALYCCFFASHSAAGVIPMRIEHNGPSRMQGIRSSLGVRARVRFRIHDSGTRQRAANSAESISSGPLFPPIRDTFGTSAVSVAIVSTT